MKKLLLSTMVVVGLNSSVWADDIPGVSDLTEPRPASTVTATNIATVVSTTEQLGTKTKTTEVVILKEPTKVVAHNTPSTALPPAVIVNAKMDMEKTMKMMGRNFRALNKASSIEDMIEPVQGLAIYASQAHAMGEHAPDAVRDSFLQGMEKLRVEIADLEASILDNDLEAAHAMLKVLDEHKDIAHKYFEVD